MATAFRPTSSPFVGDTKPVDPMSSPTTPKSNATGQSQPPPPPAVDDATTPTRSTFSTSALASQLPLPTTPFSDAVQVPEAGEQKQIPQRGNSQHSQKSKDSDDVDMDGSEGEAGGDDGGASDEESVNADGTRNGKKRKSQRFYCTDFPPCNLSFTRSEHLARHIRKHTGERPFQCHCSRRFSRLDNLRQHAQTVHVNEEIPPESLAASVTRYQRQMRSDRSRPPPARSRAATAGSGGAPRGHAKSLSTSSIASIASMSPMGSLYGPREDLARRRPAPLVMAADSRSRLSLESYRDPPIGYRGGSPSDLSTPTSATFSTGQNSPRWGSGVASPISSHSRSHSMYTHGTRTPGRRLSVPSSGYPFTTSPNAGQSRPLFGPGNVNTSNNGALSPSMGSMLTSPTTSTASYSRRDSVGSAADDAWRRRTWHPDSTFNGGGSRMSTMMNTSHLSETAPPPLPLQVVNGPSQQQPVRLPGIESFDPIPRRPISPVQRKPSPMLVDSDMPTNPPPMLPSVDPASEDRRPVAAWDAGLQRGLHRLDLASPGRDGAGLWTSEANQAARVRVEHTRLEQGRMEQARMEQDRMEQLRIEQEHARMEQMQRMEQSRLPPPLVRFDQGEPSYYAAGHQARPPSPPPTVVGRAHHQHTVSAPTGPTPREAKRMGWYHGPVTIHSAERRDPPSQPQPYQQPPQQQLPPAPQEQLRERPAHIDRMIHPNIANGFQGFPARQVPPAQQQSPTEGLGNNDAMRRLEALVAVATSESNNTATAY